MRQIIKAAAFTAALLPGIAAAQAPQFPQNLPANTVIGRLGIGPGPSQAIPFSVLSSQLTGAAITLNSGNGQTAPGPMSGGNTYSFGATTDTPRFTGIGLGGVAPATGLAIYNAPATPIAGGQGMVGASSTNGGVLIGQGSVFDASLGNKSGAVALGITTGTQNVVLQGTLTAASLSTSGTIAGSLCMTSSGVVLYEAAINCFAVSGISVASGKTLTINNTLTLSGTDGTAITFPATSGTVATLGAGQTFSGSDVFSGTLNITGTGQINGAAFGTFATQNYATPPAIGGTTPNSGAFSTLSATTPIGISSGGTNASTAAGARASGGLNVDSLTSHGDSNYSILSADRTVATSTALTAARTWTLPAASSVNAGQHLYVQDFKGFVSNTNTLTIARNGSDTINGGSGSQIINSANGGFLLIADGVSNWSAQALGAQATSGVANINGQTGGVNIVAGANTSVSTSGGNITIANTQALNSTSSITGSTTTYTSSQNAVLVQRSNSGSPMSDLLPGTSPGVLPANTVISITNNDTAGILSIKAGSGAAIKTTLASTGYLYVCPGQSIIFYSDGSNYWVIQRPVRCTLAATTAIYFSSTGSNSNDGLTTSTPMLDPIFAYNVIQSNFDGNKQNINFTVVGGSGNFTQISMEGPIPGVLNNRYTCGVSWIGNPTTPANVVVNANGVASPPGFGAIEAVNGACAVINGFQVGSTTLDNVVAYNATLFVENLILTGGRLHSKLLLASNGATQLTIIGNLSINLAAGPGPTTIDCALIQTSGATLETLNFTANITITLSGTINVNSGFVCSQYPGIVVINTPTLFAGTGTVIGLKYTVFAGGSFNSGSVGLGGFPGTISGTGGTTTGGGFAQ